MDEVIVVQDFERMQYFETDSFDLIDRDLSEFGDQVSDAHSTYVLDDEIHFCGWVRGESYYLTVYIS